jgi:heme exporter protein B
VFEEHPRSSGLSAFRVTLKRDLLVAFKRRNDLLNPLMFFFIVVSLFPIGITPERDDLAEIAVGVLWVCALLASLLSLDNLYRTDFEDGALELLVLSPHSLYFMVLAKILSHWLVSGVPLVLLSPILGYMLALPAEAYLTMIVTLVLGTPILSLLGSIGVALTVSLGSRGLILAMIILPMSVPVLIAGTLAVGQAVDGNPVGGHLAIMGAMLAMAISLAPLASAAALRISIN